MYSSILSLTSLLEVGGQRHAPTASSPPQPGETDTVAIVLETGWAPGPVWTCAKYLTPSGIRSPDRPARRERALVVDDTEVLISP